jgi:enoyl-CoA hydratase/carnithine racemase
MTVHVEDRDGVRRVTLARPPVNALSMAEYGALVRAFTFDGTAADAPRIVHLRAEGPVWCAGQDLQELEALADGEARAGYLERAALGVAAAAGCPVPVVTALDGQAVGAGALLVACSDLVLATPDAGLAFPEVRLGLHLGRALLTGLLPDQVIAYALATGARLDVPRLHAWGLVAEVVPAPELAARTEVVLTDLLELPDESLRWIRAGRRPAERATAYLREVAGSAREGSRPGRPTDRR